MTGAARLTLCVLLVAACSTTGVEEPGARPDLNRRFRSPDLDVAEFTGIFETESREIFSKRHQILESLELRPGMAVADVGAGTGLFLELFADALGPTGRLYAIDIAPGFVGHLRERARKEGLDRVEVILGQDRSVELPEHSVDLVFLCDTYHHFEFPRAMLASIQQALRPGGKLVVIDFERIPAVTRDWLLEHVRASKTEVTIEIADSGFVFEEELQVEGLEENYVLRFRRP